METNLQIFLKGVNGKTIILNDSANLIRASTTVAALRKIITAKTGIKEEEQVLVYAGKPLYELNTSTNTAMTVGDYNM